MPGSRTGLTLLEGWVEVQAVDRGARKPTARTYRAVMPYADWAVVTRDLSTALAELADGEFLVLGEATPAPGPRRLFGWPAGPLPVRYVQALLIDEVLSAECVGAVCLGGTWQMDDSTVERLRCLGWLTPEESRAEFGDVTPNFDTYVEQSCAAGLADLMVASLALLGAEPQSLELHLSGRGLSAVSG